MRYSVLDLAPVPEGSDAATAFSNSVDLARHAEAEGYHRVWYAEHHNMPGIASAATAVLIGHVAQQTSTIRVGSGGIMLPNHSPLAVAEAFGTLATLYPGRIDLGLGRAPGGDMAVIRAMRRQGGNDFANDVVELQSYFAKGDHASGVRAVPGQGTDVPLTILGSSLYGAQLAAHLGLPFAFASHFAPDMLDEAFAIYRDRFRPSAQCERPHAILAANVFAAESTEAALRLKSSSQIAFARLRSGQFGLFPAPVDDIDAAIGPEMRRAVDQALRISATGTAPEVKRQLGALIDRYAPDEVIVAAQIHDQTARRQSLTLAAEALRDVTLAAA